MILQRYILSETIRAFLFVFIVLFAIVVVTGPVVRFYKESEMMGTDFLTSVLPYFIPMILVHIIPLATLVATIFVFGRLTEDNEIMAMRSSGIYLLSLLRPTILFGLLLGMMVISLNIFIIPACQSQTRLITTSALKNSIVSPSLITRTIRLSKEYQIYYNDIQNGVLIDVTVAQLDKEGRLTQHIKAERGELEFDDKTSQLEIQLEKITQTNWKTTATKDGSIPLKREHEIRTGSKTSVTLDLSGLLIPKPKNLAALSQVELNDLIRESESAAHPRFPLSELLMEKHRRYALGLTPFIFLLIGLPVGLLVQKGSKMAGLAIGVLIVFGLYYPLTMIGTTLGATGRLPPVGATWLANITLGIISGLLLYKTLKR